MEKQGYKQWKAGHGIRTEALVQYPSYWNMYTRARNTLIHESGSMPFQPANVPMAFTLQVDKSRSTDTEMKKHKIHVYYLHINYSVCQTIITIGQTEAKYSTCEVLRTLAGA